MCLILSWLVSARAVYFPCNSAMTRRLSSRRRRASSSAGSAPSRTKPPSRLLSGSVSESVSPSIFSNSGVMPASRAPAAEMIALGVGCSASSADRRSRATASPSRRPARSRGPPRSEALRRDMALAMSGAARRRARKSPRKRASSMKAPTASSRRLIPAGSVSGPRQPFGKEPRAGGRNGRIDRRQKRTPGVTPLQSARQFKIGPRRRIDLHRLAARAAGRALQRGTGVDLRSADVMDRQRRGADLRRG